MSTPKKQLEGPRKLRFSPKMRRAQPDLSASGGRKKFLGVGLFVGAIGFTSELTLSLPEKPQPTTGPRMLSFSGALRAPLPDLSQGAKKQTWRSIDLFVGKIEVEHTLKPPTDNPQHTIKTGPRLLSFKESHLMPCPPID